MILPKQDKPGIDIMIRPGTKEENRIYSCHTDRERR